MADHALQLDGDPGGPTLVLAHGAGAPLDSPFLEQTTASLVERGLRVARFEFPYMAERRDGGRRRPPDPAVRLLATYREVVAQLGSASDLVLGGKSLGGRIASMVADELGARGLVCLGYPFHPPAHPNRLRTAHLLALRTPTLIVQGERDPFGTRGEVAELKLSAAIQVSWLPDGDHSFKPRVRSGVTEADNLTACAAAVAAFVHGLQGQV